MLAVAVLVLMLTPVLRRGLVALAVVEQVRLTALLLELAELLILVVAVVEAHTTGRHHLFVAQGAQEALVL
jgi:hypothetical protein